MKRRTGITVFVIVALLLAGGWLLWRNRSSARMATYQGKTAEYWLTQILTTNQPKAWAAFKEMGSNAIPVLVEAFKKRDYAWNKYYQKKYPRLPVWMKKRLPAPQPATESWGAAQLVVINQLSTKAILPDLMQMLAEKHSPTRGIIMNCVLSYVGPEDTNCLPVLIDCLGDTNLDVRYQAILGIERLEQGAHAAVLALTVVMNDRTMANTWPAGFDAAFETRLAAARAVWKISGQTNGPDQVFREGLNATNSRVQGVAGMDLIEMEPQDLSLIPRIIDLLAASDPGIRQSAASALGNYGPAAKAAVPALERTMTSSDFELRRRALASLKKIDPAMAAKYQH